MEFPVASSSYGYNYNYNNNNNCQSRADDQCCPPPCCPPPCCPPPCPPPCCPPPPPPCCCLTQNGFGSRFGSGDYARSVKRCYQMMDDQCCPPPCPPPCCSPPPPCCCPPPPCCPPPCCPPPKCCCDSLGSRDVLKRFDDDDQCCPPPCCPPPPPCCPPPPPKYCCCDNAYRAAGSTRRGMFDDQCDICSSPPCGCQPGGQTATSSPREIVKATTYPSTPQPLCTGTPSEIRQCYSDNDLNAKLREEANKQLIKDRQDKELLRRRARITTLGFYQRRRVRCRKCGKVKWVWSSSHQHQQAGGSAQHHHQHNSRARSPGLDDAANYPKRQCRRHAGFHSAACVRSQRQRHL